MDADRYITDATAEAALNHWVSIAGLGWTTHSQMLSTLRAVMPGIVQAIQADVLEDLAQRLAQRLNEAPDHGARLSAHWLLGGIDIEATHARSSQGRHPAAGHTFKQHRNGRPPQCKCGAEQVLVAYATKAHEEATDGR